MFIATKVTTSGTPLGVRYSPDSNPVKLYANVPHMALLAERATYCYTNQKHRTPSGVQTFSPIRTINIPLLPE